MGIKMHLAKTHTLMNPKACHKANDLQAHFLAQSDTLSYPTLGL